MKLLEERNKHLRMVGTVGIATNGLAQAQYQIAAECFGLLAPYGGSLPHATEAYVAMLTRCLVIKTITELYDGYLADCTARLKRH